MDSPSEETDRDVNLDPQDWEEFREIGYSMIDLLVDYHKDVRDRPVWQPIPDKIKSELDKPLPQDGQSYEDIMEEFRELILPYPTGNIHPRFWGWVHGTGTSFGALAELMAAMMNPNTGGREHIANYVELQVIEWVKKMVGFASEASGLLTSGCSMANLTGLAVARQAKSGVDVRKQGLQSLPKRLTVYGSQEMHSSIQKGLEVLGFGSESLRTISVNDSFQIDIAELQATIQKDREDGFKPLAIVGNVGTVNSGAIDDIQLLREVADHEDMWLHLDGAFGAIASIVPEYQDRLGYLDLADSLAFDMHKWMYMPYEIGCILVQNENIHKGTFSLRPDYLSQMSRGLASFDRWPTEYGVELSRGFRALKAWMSLKEHGIEKYQKVVQKNILQARYFGELIASNENLELLAPISMNVVCFRFVHPAIPRSDLEDVNRELLIRVQESGVAVFSSTFLNGIYSLRIANTNQRSKFDDFDLLEEHISKIGNEIVAEWY